MTHKGELAELKARVAELERAAKPPEPYIDDWVPPPRPIDRVSMPMSAMRELAQAVPDSVLRDIVGDNRAPQGPARVIPSTVQQDVPRGVPGGGTGWAHEVPISNPPGVAQADRLMDAADRRDLENRVLEEAQRQVLLKPTEKS